MLQGALSKNPKTAKRNLRVKRAIARGQRQVDVATKFQLTQARVSQIVNDPVCHLTLADVQVA